MNADTRRVRTTRTRLPVPPDWRPLFEARVGWLMLAGLVWTVIVGLRLAQVTLTGRDEVLARAAATAWRTGSLPALRGRLVDQQGLPLAWSERQFALEYGKAATAEGVWEDLYALQDRLGLNAGQLRIKVAYAPAPTVIIKPQLTAAEVIRLQPLLTPGSPFRVISRFIRRQADLEPQVARQLGECRQFGPRQLGVSGWEAAYNRQLLGAEGRYRVMVDRDGRWIPETWQELQAPLAGRDVYLPLRLPPPAPATVSTVDP